MEGIILISELLFLACLLEMVVCNPAPYIHHTHTIEHSSSFGFGHHPPHHEPPSWVKQMDEDFRKAELDFQRREPQYIVEKHHNKTMHDPQSHVEKNGVDIIYLGLFVLFFLMVIIGVYINKNKSTFKGNSNETESTRRTKIVILAVFVGVFLVFAVLVFTGVLKTGKMISTEELGKLTKEMSKVAIEAMKDHKPADQHHHHHSVSHVTHVSHNSVINVG